MHELSTNADELKWQNGPTEKIFLNLSVLRLFLEIL